MSLGSALTAGFASAQEKVPVPIGSGARKAEPLPSGDRIELSLDQAIALALKNALDLDVSSYSYESAEGSITAARGMFDPYLRLDLGTSSAKSAESIFSELAASSTKGSSADLTFGGLSAWGTSYSLAWTNQRTDTQADFVRYNPRYSTSLTGSIRQPLLRDFGKGVNTRLVVQSRLARDVAAWDFVVAIQTAVQTVDSAYWDLVYAVENLKAKQEALDRAKDLNRITRIKIDVGALAPIDVVQTEVTIAQREQEIILAEGQIGDAQDRLKRLLNVNQMADWNRPLVPTDRPSDVAVTVNAESGIQRALETRPEVKQAVADIESKKVSLAYNRNQLLPRLDFDASYGQSGVGANTTIIDSQGRPIRSLDYADAFYAIRGADYPAWSVGLSFLVPLHNRTAKGNAVVAKTNLELSRTNLALLKQNLVLDVRSSARAVDTALRSVAAAKKARELAERNLDAEKKKYENGMTTSFQVAQIQNDLTSARSNELLAIAGYQKAITSWHKATGDLLDEKRISVEGLPVSLGPTPPEEGAVR